MNTSVVTSASERVFQSAPDTGRPTVSTAEAAKRCGLSRYYVAELVRQGRIDGFGIRHHEGGRVRWYVYADAVPDQQKRREETSPGPESKESLKRLLQARACARQARAERDHAHGALLNFADARTNALGEGMVNDFGKLAGLLLKAQIVRNDEQRHLLTAQRHEADAEACLDAALGWLMGEGEEVESWERKKVTHASCQPGPPLAVPARRGVARAGPEAQELLSRLLHARACARDAHAERSRAHRMLLDLIDNQTAAIRAGMEGDASRLAGLLLEAEDVRNDEQRHLLTAQRHEADAEACLDAALGWLMGEKVESYARDDAEPGSHAEITAAQAPQDRDSRK